MTRDGKIARAIRCALWTSAAAVAATSLPVYSQDQDEATPQTVIVTGSRISRPELDTTAPVLALGQQDLQSQGLNNIADIAAQLPQFSAAFGASRTQSTFSGADFSGLNEFNLRNLDPVRTLTLINGRRAPGGRTTSTAVDFNLIPTANIERFELLTGGASAVYGADAVAGVVNLITRKNFTGIEFGANYSETADSDNKSPGGYMMLGGAWGDTGRGTLTIEYQKQGLVRCADRYLCAEDFAWTDSSTAPLRGPAAYSGVAPVAKFQAGTTGPSYTAHNGSYTDASGALIPFSTPVDGFNRNAERTLAIPTRRFMVAAEGEVGLPWAGIKGFAEFNYGESRTDAPFEGHPFQSATAGSFFGGGPGLTPIQASVPITNPFIPTALYNKAIANGVNATTGILNWQQRFDAVDGTRGATNTREMYRGVVGVRGEFESIAGFGSGWSWEISHLYGRTTLDSITNGLVGTDRLYYGLRVEQDPTAPAGTYRCIDPGARATGCVPINPFAPYTQAMKAYLSESAGQSGRNDLEDSTAFLSGTLFPLPAGGLQAVVGAERRSFAGFLDYDTQINNATVTGNQIGDVDRVKTVTNEVFAEVKVPVLKDLPFAESLDVDGSYRKSNPTGPADSYNTWGYGMNWQPLGGLRLRASKARAVRTPVPDDLSGVGQTFGVVNDPCTQARRNQNATRSTNCAADGVPSNYVPPLTVEQAVAGFVGGNPDLAPEVGDTTTFGFVWQPTFVQGLVLSVDRFRINLKNVINTVGRQTKADLCYDTPDRLFCSDLQRGVNPNTPGNWALIAVNDQLVNVASIKLAGYDIEAGYRFGLGHENRFGTLNVRALMTIYDRAEQTPLPGEDPIDYLGYAGGSTSDQGWLKKQGTLELRWGYHAFGASWHARYIGSAFMAPGAEDFGKIGSRFYHDVRFNYDFGEGSQVYLGIDNVADKSPPFFATGTSGTQALDTIPAYYDVFGRTYFGGVRFKF